MSPYPKLAFYSPVIALGAFSTLAARERFDSFVMFSSPVDLHGPTENTNPTKSEGMCRSFMPEAQGARPPVLPPPPGPHQSFNYSFNHPCK